MARTAKQIAAQRKAALASARKRKGKGKGKATSSKARKKSTAKPQRRVMSKKEKSLRYAVAAASFASAGIQTYRFVKFERQLARSRKRK